jgi:hypothetical protein
MPQLLGYKLLTKSYRDITLPDSQWAVESERKNPFTITGFSVGKPLYAESISPKGRINSQVIGWFQADLHYALDSTS